MMGRVSLVAHRGQPMAFPENSLAGFIHALEAGASYVETDVQITSDGVPVLSHDANLLKVTGKQIIVGDHPWSLISDIGAGYEERFGSRFSDYRIASLKDFVKLMQSWPDVTCFIELKEACLQNFGLKAVDLVLENIAAIRSQAVLISYDHDALSYARESDPSLPLGWVLPDWNEDNRSLAQQLKPEFLFVDDKFCPDDQSDIWPGRWQWVAYTINETRRVDHYAGLGIEIIETDRYTEIIQESDNIDVSHDF